MNGNYNLTTANTTCVSCHLKDFQGATNPNHVTSGFPQTCQQCHNSTTWTSATFDHSTTGFPLVGAHVSVGCGAVSREWQLQLDYCQYNLRQLPSEGFPGRDESEPCELWFRADLPAVSQHHHLDGRQL